MSAPILSKLLPISDLFGKIGGLIDALHTSTEEKLAASLKLAEARQAFELELAKVDAQLEEQQAKVIIAEAQGQDKAQRRWRPHLMYLFMMILANNFIVAPYAKAAGLDLPLLEIPLPMWTLLTIGLGGYLGARSWEKTKGVA